MKKIIMAASVIGLGLGFAKAASNNSIGRTIPGTSLLQAAKTETKHTVPVCYVVCELNKNCYTECTTTKK